MVELYILGGAAALLVGTVARSAVKVIYRKVIRAKLKGHIGERKVSSVMKRFSRKNGKVKNDILIRHGKGTSQIDHLLITKKGIVVLETKNYSGNVYGKEKERMWTQVFPGSYKNSRSFYNPIQQNKGHIHALQEILGDRKDIPMKSLVVFTGNCTFPNLPGVISHKDLNAVLKFMNSGPDVLTNEQVKEIEKAIEQSTIAGSQARKKHNFNAQINSQVSPDEIQQMIQQGRENSIPNPNRFIPPEREMTLAEIRRQSLNDTHAKLSIKGKMDTIEGHFEKAKRRNDGDPVPMGGNFDYFICPFTGDKFDVSNAIHLYQGLWITYLNQNPELVKFMYDYGAENLGNSYRCRKVLNAYSIDKDAFTAQVKATEWYTNMANKINSRTTEKTTGQPPLSSKISNAEKSFKQQSKKPKLQEYTR